ncbi:hypothetical protein FQN54_000473 [Arachnomyces sp. PD_36]|nr:hypothetical protein FQN54_000473 [Arachnomyces sp. PD_36]
MTINSLWFKWKSLKLPWRKTFLRGSDLAGNTFWEFKDAITAGRMRRIVKYNPKTHYADVKVSPQWHQWLRHVRPDAPTIEEQQNELVRQAQMKELARLADERWAEKPSYLDKPKEQQTGPAMRTSDPTYELGHKEEGTGVKNAVGTPEEVEEVGKKKSKKSKKPNPWAKEAGGPSEGWQPESWTPGAAKR